MAEFPRPVLFGDQQFEAFIGGADPAAVHTLAHETARVLVERARSTQDEAVIQRLVSYTDQHGIEQLTELWSYSSPRSLPGVLWRIYLLRSFIRQHTGEVSHLFQLGSSANPTIHPVVAGVEAPLGPEEVLVTADEILRGMFQDDLAVALERAASFCHIVAAGALERADALDAVNGAQARTLTSQAELLTGFAEQFQSGARLWRMDALD